LGVITSNVIKTYAEQPPGLGFVHGLNFRTSEYLDGLTSCHRDEDDQLPSARLLRPRMQSPLIVGVAPRLQPRGIRATTRIRLPLAHGRSLASGSAGGASGVRTGEVR